MPSQDSGAKIVRDGSGLARLQWAAAAALLALPVGLLLWQLFFSQSGAFLFGDTERAAWITYPHEPSPLVVVVDPTDAKPLTFRRDFTLAQSPDAATLHVRALREVELFVNAVRIPPADHAPQGFRSASRVDIAAQLRAGRNEIRADVRNPTGPRLLMLWIDGLPERIATDTAWSVALESRAAVPAMLADDTAINVQTLDVKTPRESLADQRALVWGAFAVCCAVFLLARRGLDESHLARLPLVTLLALTAVWVWIFVAKTTQIPLEYGFDSRGHLQYIDTILEQRSLPRPGRGWSTFHPPLFYALSAGLEGLVGAVASGMPRAVVLRVVPFLSGLGIVWLGWPLARRIFRDDPRRVTAALLVAGALPLNLYMSSYVGNESLHAFFATVCILATVVALLEPAGRSRTLLLTGAAFGLALLTKVTAIVVLALAGVFVLWKLLAVERRPPTRALTPLALLALGPLALAGWYYALNLHEFGTPLVGNWADLSHMAWWQHPGFHTPAYFLAFGESFHHPYLSAYRSFWDGLYTTLWGDGLVSARVRIATRHPFWNYDFMSITYLLAFPATLLAIFGFFRTAARAWRERDPLHQLALLFLLVLSAFMLGALCYFPFVLPAYGSAKFGYALLLVAPLAILLAEGFCTLDAALAAPRWLAVRTIYHGWFGTFLVVSLLAFAG